MNEILPDGGKPIKVGDPSFVYKNVYNPITWLGDDPYRPRVEMLVIKDRRQVFLRRYDKNESEENFKYNYRIPGGSTDTDSTKLQQAIAETNEEGLLAVKNVKDVQVQYYEQYKPGFLKRGGDSPLEYKGSINDVFVSEYAGSYDKKKIDPKDLDDDMAKNGAFYPIAAIAGELKPEHANALIKSGLIEPYLIGFIRRVCSLTGTVVDTKSQQYIMDDPISTLQGVHLQESVEVPGGLLYHGSTYKIDEFKPMSLDIGNINQKPGWSTFCFARKDFAIRFGLMRLIQKAIQGADASRSNFGKCKCEWSVRANKPFVNGYFLAPLVVGDKFYVYTLDPDKLDVHFGNDAKFPEYTFRESGIIPVKTEEYEVTPELLRDNIIMAGSQFDEMKRDNDEVIDSLGNTARRAMLNHDYNADSVVGKLEDAVKSGELKPGDDIEAYMTSHNLEFKPDNWIGSRMEFSPDDFDADTYVSEASDAGVSINATASIADLQKFQDSSNGLMINKHLDIDSLGDRDPKIAIAYVNKKPAGYVVVCNASVSMHRQEPYIIALEVKPEYQHSGIGTKLLQVAKSKYSAKWLTVRNSNTGAISLYKKNGFKTYLDNGTVHIMKRGFSLPFEHVSEAKTPYKESDYGLPDKKKYPMPDAKHVRSAIKFFNYVDKEDEAILARNINKKIKKFGIKDQIHVGPNNRFSKYWDGPVTESADFGYDPRVPFDVAKAIDDMTNNNFQPIMRGVWNNLDNIVYYDSTKVGNYTAGTIVVFRDDTTKNGYLLMTFDLGSSGYDVSNGLMDDLLRVYDTLGVDRLYAAIDADYDAGKEFFMSYGFKELPADDSTGVIKFVLSKGTDISHGTKVMESTNPTLGDVILRCDRATLFQTYQVSPYPIPDNDLPFDDSIPKALNGLNIRNPLPSGLYYVFTKIGNQIIQVGRIVVRQEDFMNFTWYDCKPMGNDLISQVVTSLGTDKLTETAINLTQKVLHGENDYGVITEASDGSKYMTLSKPDKVVMEAPGDSLTATDYTKNEADAGQQAASDNDSGDNTLTATDYSAGDDDAGDDDNQNDNPLGANDDAPDDNAGGDDAGGDDMGGGDDDSLDATDYTDNMGDDGSSSDDSGMSDDSEDSDSSMDSDNSDSSNNNILVKNYSLVRDFEKMFSLIDDVSNTIESTLKATSEENQVLVQVSRNLSNIKEFIKTFIQFHFKDNDYEYNLYYYMIAVQYLRINLQMVEKIAHLGDDRA